MPPLTGLFLGAGASSEVGMPLVWELTEVLRPRILRDKLRAFNESWKRQGGGQSDVVVDDLAQVATRLDMHYENILGYIETQYRRPGPLQQEYHYFYGWVADLVYHLLLFRHVHEEPYLASTLPFMSGIKQFATENAPLWVFSLNHDIIVECLAAAHGIPLSSGFGPEAVTLPRHDALGVKIGTVRAEIISGEDLDRLNTRFLPHGTFGVNLLKIHGALDVFAFHEGRDFMKLLPEAQTPAGLIAALRVANEELRWVHPQTKRQAKATNEIAYADDNGAMQFLRRTLLAGAFKFDDRRPQVLSKKFLEVFRFNINCVSKLVCIGYGFGDAHINDVIRGWLELTQDRQLEIVTPGPVKLPPSLMHLAPQIFIVDAKATDYLDRIAGITRSRGERVQKRLAAWSRRKSGDEFRAEFQAFQQSFIADKMKEFSDRLEAARNNSVSAPPRDEQSNTAEVRRIAGEVWGTAEDLLEAFLNTRDSK